MRNCPGNSVAFGALDAGKSYTFTVAAKDAAGNVDPTPESFTFVAGPPAKATVTPQFTSPTRSGTVTFTLSDASSYECWIDDLPSSTCPSTTTISQLQDGNHTLHVLGIDDQGVEGASQTTYDFAVDTHAPDAPTIGKPVDGMTINTDTVTVSGTAEPGTSVEIFIDGKSQGASVADDTGFFSFDAEGLTEGDHAITAQATDAAGNASPVSTPTALHVVFAGPTAVVTGPTGMTRTTDASFTFAPPARPSCAASTVAATSATAPTGSHCTTSLMATTSSR